MSDECINLNVEQGTRVTQSVKRVLRSDSAISRSFNADVKVASHRSYK